MSQSTSFGCQWGSEFVTTELPSLSWSMSSTFKYWLWYDQTAEFMGSYFSTPSPNTWSRKDSFLVLLILRIWNNIPVFLKVSILGTSLVVHWLRTCLPMQGVQVRSLVWEDFSCHRVTKPLCLNYLSLGTLEPMFYNKRSHCNDKPMHCNYKVAPAHWDYRNHTRSNEDLVQPKINK